MRVVHCVAGLGQGGAERQLALLCRATAGQVRHEVFAARAGGFHAAEFERLGVPVTGFGARRLWSPALAVRMAARLRSIEADVLHCWLPSMNLMGALAAALCWPRRPAVIASIRNVDDWKGTLRRATDRWASQAWDRVLCNSLAGLRCAERQGIAREKLHWVANGVEARTRLTAAERDDMRRALGVAGDAPLLVSACRLVEQKQVHRVLELAARLRPRLPALRVAICGDGPLAAPLRAQAAALGLSETVHFLGAVDDAWPYLCAADVLAMTSLREGTSNTLLEALQAGCAVCATDAGDNVALVGGAAGWTGPYDEMAGALERLLARPGMLAQARVSALARAAEFSVERMALATLAHYEQVARGRSRPDRTAAGSRRAEPWRA